MADDEFVHYMGAQEGGETSLCGLTPPADLLTFDWKAVTCKTCRKHQPK